MVSLAIIQGLRTHIDLDQARARLELKISSACHPFVKPIQSRVSHLPACLHQVLLPSLLSIFLRLSFPSNWGLLTFAWATLYQGQQWFISINRHEAMKNRKICLGSQKAGKTVPRDKTSDSSNGPQRPSNSTQIYVRCSCALLSEALDTLCGRHGCGCVVMS